MYNRYDRDPEIIKGRIQDMVEEAVATHSRDEAIEVLESGSDMNLIAEAFESFVGQMDKERWQRMVQNGGFDGHFGLTMKTVLAKSIAETLAHDMRQDFNNIYGEPDE